MYKNQNVLLFIKVLRKILKNIPLPLEEYYHKMDQAPELLHFTLHETTSWMLLILCQIFF